MSSREPHPLGLLREGDIDPHTGLVVNEVGGVDLFTAEPHDPCPKCGEPMDADFCDNGFGPYAVQVGPFHCVACGHID